MGLGRRGSGGRLICWAIGVFSFSASAIAQGVYEPAPTAGPPGAGAGIGAVPGGAGGFGVPGVNAPPGAAIAPGGAVPQGPAWRLVPAIEIGQAYNDNVALAPKGQEVADFITTISPSLALTGDTARLHAFVLYDPQELIFDRGTFSPTLQQRLLGLGSAVVVPEALFLDARASIDQEFLRTNPATGQNGPIGASTLTTSGNLQTVETASASPYLLQRFGPYVNSESRYSFATITTSGGIVAPEQIQEARQRFTSGTDFDRLGWAVTGDAIQIDRLKGTSDPLGGTTGKDRYGKADLRYLIYGGLSAIGSGGYERLSDQTLTVQPHGPIWSAGLAYEPSPYLSAFATYGRRFDRSDVEALASYTPDPNFQLRGIYTLTYQTSQSAIVSNLNQATVGPNGTLINSQTGQPFVVVNNATPGTPSSAFGITTGSFFEKRYEADVIWTRERNTFSLTAYDVKNSGDAIVVQTERIFGGTLAWTRLLWPNLTLTSAAAYYRALFEDGTGRRDNSYTLSLGLAYTFTPTWTGRLTVTRLDTESNVPADSLVNDIVFVSIRKQF